MAERSVDRAPSVSSSLTEADNFDGNEKSSSSSSTDEGFTKLRAPDEMEIEDDVERAGLLPADQQEKPQAPAQETYSTRTAIIWMVVNTLATIGIVSAALSISTTHLTCVGFYEQSNLLRPYVEARTAFLRCLPFLHNMAYAVHTFETKIRNVRAQESCDPGDHSSGDHNVPKCHPAQPLPRLLDRHILPSSQNLTYTRGGSHELRSLQTDPTPKRDTGFNTGLLRSWNGLILRFFAQPRCECKDNYQFGSYLCIFWHICKLTIHRLGLQLPQEIADE